MCFLLFFGKRGRPKKQQQQQPEQQQQRQQQTAATRTTAAATTTTATAATIIAAATATATATAKVSHVFFVSISTTLCFSPLFPFLASTGFENSCFVEVKHRFSQQQVSRYPPPTGLPNVAQKESKMESFLRYFVALLGLF